MKKYAISPSLLSADFARLGEEVDAVLAAGADRIHFDVMDNHYVPNLSVGPLVCQALRDYGIKAPIDVHLMTQPVDDLILKFAKAGATEICFHPDASIHVNRSLQYIRDAGCAAGLAFNPATPLHILPYVEDQLDRILIMTVNPGFGGQQCIPSVFAKIKEAATYVAQSGKSIGITVDGGVKEENIGMIAAQGADTFVAGSAVFESKNYAETIAALRRAITEGIS